MFRMMRAVPRMASMRAATGKGQTVVTNKKMVPTLTGVSRTLPVVQARGVASVATQDIDTHTNQRYIAYFNRADIDGWEVRKAMADLMTMDLVPHPSVVGAALRACMRINEFSLSSKILEVIRVKCGDKEANIWPYMIQELKALGVSLPSGY